MLERDYLVAYHLSKESVNRLFRKAENERLAKLIQGNQPANAKILNGFFGLVNFLLAAVLIIH